MESNTKVMVPTTFTYPSMLTISSAAISLHTVGAGAHIHIHTHQSTHPVLAYNTLVMYKLPLLIWLVVTTKQLDLVSDSRAGSATH